MNALVMQWPWASTVIILVQGRLRTEVHALQVQPDRGSNSLPSDHDSAVNVTETTLT